MRLYLTALKPTDSVTDGFLPAAEALGCEVTILTDRPERHPYAVACDVRDPRALIDTVEHLGRPDAIFTNSDHLQAETALAAAYFGLPGKDWRACVAAKNKFLMRRELLRAGIEQVWSTRLAPGDPVPEGVPYPVVLKPREGVASEDVMLVERDLAWAVAEVRKRRPGEALVVEEYLEGPLRTLETLGDSSGVRVLGGFETTLGALPYFIEERLDWAAPDGSHEHVLGALRALGVGFGACHTEYVLTPGGPRIVEVNYRVIGDHCDFLLADVLGVPLFEWILRAHLGEPVPAVPAASGHGSAVSLVADRPGTVKDAPGAEAVTDGDVRLWHRPLRAVGDTVSLTHTNRDYLAVVRAVGPSRQAVDAAIAAYRAARPWVVE
ncbi:siderophore biosynthesis protein [Nonomuraea phyllanthi]|uniref:Siderophore biosynthesis protein n=1 Tax=Nonomuraea phyllanthi TaxID=2219224 RepID=A0A5C4UXK3_9ACTN|nr:siderophore biosynthesis protein [Nonomuraea phyllanthi]KAB8183311.1 siderophore biosynthesis protein [Nonomuraea phyllanthi]QFY12624.1 siderophore biosynthesis protein [Nonomuraea phyllanthi]